MITERIEKRQKEKDELQAQLAVEMGKEITFTAPQIKAFLNSLQRGNINDEITRRGLVNIFVRAIYLYDDRMTLILNGGDRPITIDDILLDEIEGHFQAAISSRSPCSPLVADVPAFAAAFLSAYATLKQHNSKRIMPNRICECLRIIRKCDSAAHGRRRTKQNGAAVVR